MSRTIALENIRIDRSFLMNLAGFFSDQIGTCLLYSGGNFESAKKSYLFLFPYDFIWIKGGKQWRTNLGTQKKTYLSLSNPWDAYKLLLPEFDSHKQYPEWVGFFSYEMGAFSDQEKRLPYQYKDSPDSYMQRSAVMLIVDHQTEQGTLIIADQADYVLEEKQRHWVEYLSNKHNWPELATTLSDTGKEKISQQPLSLSRPLEDRGAYVGKIEQAKEMIRAGDIYQINLSQQFSLSGKRNPFHLFRNLAKINPAPFSAYLRLKDFTIVSSSPERFLHKSGGLLETRPIKGTIPRGKDPDEDARNRELLLSSPKEKAELLMITDLMRNDLGKVSLAGSVKTEQLWCCEEYANVFHLLSVIRSKPKPEIYPIEIIRSCFPGGSITGCPKLSAMEAISQLEKRPRGIYTGAIGYISGNGDFDFNIAIRTIVMAGDSIDVQLGGAIVEDSDPGQEYEETLHKGASIFKALDFQEKLEWN